ncbi:hypothetical protein TNCV_1779121 [Trichonephila clavipes]|nr:hypothetical protein TNCV_1779121 [Trichonephila clavipes]
MLDSFTRSSQKLTSQCAREASVGLAEVVFCTEQDDVPPYFHTDVPAYLHNVAPGHWIGRRDPIEYSTFSSDLTPLHFYLWGYFKNVVYSKKPLTQEIETSCRETPFSYSDRCH